MGPIRHTEADASTGLEEAQSKRPSLLLDPGSAGVTEDAETAWLSASEIYEAARVEAAQ